MLNFFRKYQRIFFIFIAIVIAVSFSFFGTQSTLMPKHKRLDHEIGLAFDGSKMKRSEIDELMRFLASDRLDMQMHEQGKMPNYFNNGVVRFDLFQSGLAEVLFASYFENLREEMATRINQFKRFVPYKHPHTPFISAENIWAQVHPEHKRSFDAFMSHNQDLSPETLTSLTQLYLGESAFPSYVLRQYLLYQQKQFTFVQPDPSLEQAPLTLFHCYTLKDWFGETFLELVAQLIHNGALVAQEKGYAVSFEEARVDLIHNGIESLKGQLGVQEVQEERLEEFWKNQLLALHLEEKAAIKVWQKVMLFRRLFEDYGQAIFLDSHLQRTLDSFLAQTVDVDLYQLPDSLQLTTFQDLFKLQTYLEQVSSIQGQDLTLPQESLPLPEIQKRCPKLLEKRFLVECAAIKQEDVSLNVGLKEMWEWQLDKDNFILLQQEFPALLNQESFEREALEKTLGSLEKGLRKKVDAFSRLSIVQAHPDWLIQALDEAPLHTEVLGFSLAGDCDASFQVDNGKALLALFEMAALKEDLPFKDEEAQARKELEMVQINPTTYARFHVLDQGEDYELLTFHEAHAKGVLDHLVDTKLEMAYSTLCLSKPHLFKDAKGLLKPFDEVKDSVGKEVYRDCLHAMKRDYLLFSQEDTQDYDLQVQHRLFAYMREAQADLIQKGDQSSYLQKHLDTQKKEKLELKPPFEEQWKLKKDHQVFHRKHHLQWADQKVFQEAVGSWSSVRFADGKRVGFYQIKQKGVDHAKTETQIYAVKEKLAKEAKRSLMLDLVQQLKQKDVIYLTSEGK